MGGSLLVESEEGRGSTFTVELACVDNPRERLVRGRNQETAAGAPEATCDIPVVIISADATAGQQERLLKAGASAYLTKPLDVDRLLETVDGALKQVA